MLLLLNVEEERVSMRVAALPVDHVLGDFLGVNLSYFVTQTIASIAFDPRVFCSVIPYRACPLVSSFVKL